MGRDLEISSEKLQIKLFQSTRPHGARHLNDKKYKALSLVSIHAPAWGATLDPKLRGTLQSVFQSTRPHGARLDAMSDICFEKAVSIHAPAWGATVCAIG